MLKPLDDFHKREAWKHYIREVRWRAFRHFVTDVFWPLVAMALVVLLILKTKGLL